MDAKELDKELAPMDVNELENESTPIDTEELENELAPKGAKDFEILKHNAPNKLQGARDCKATRAKQNVKRL